MTKENKSEEDDPMVFPKTVTIFILGMAIFGSIVMIFLGYQQQGFSLYNNIILSGGLVALTFWSLAGCFFWILFTIEKNTRAK